MIDLLPNRIGYYLLTSTMSVYEARIRFIDSDDAARFLLHAAENRLLGPYNAGSPGDISLQELLDRISAATGKEALITDSSNSRSRSPYDVGHSFSLDVSKAVSSGFRFRWLDDILKELIPYFLQRR
ncbi:hypothetical protein NDK47_09235 [Brevibacillus ruminantium]|uniref:dTDP-4-dehydrorhamnose reductase n=1 Tax=Brevibacillus ruminantium TaxID=2950604 RepID=A0ABY4WJZ5_9BACL|nr:hypothetical protein [Brevibacillus ruminantium]USG67437.1 hypothetical protein NDK47_09235 [Brevibacillus ruminantium]